MINGLFVSKKKKILEECSNSIVKSICVGMIIHYVGSGSSTGLQIKKNGPRASFMKSYIYEEYLL